MSEGDQDMGTGDMHGGSLEFKDREGNPVNFEVVRLGTTKELATVKAALANMTTQRDGVRETNLVLHQKVDDTSVKLEAADSGYRDEKETSADLNTKLLEAQAELTRSDAARAQLRDANAGLSDEKQGLCTELEAANEKIVSTHEWGAAAVRREQALKDDLAAARAELENLMTVKASLEESTTALEVKSKELCESREELATFKTGMLDALEQHVETHKTWLDQIRGFLAGE